MRDSVMRRFVQPYGITGGTVYPEGSLTTRQGGLWHAMKDTKDTPGGDGSAWLLVVKRSQA